MQTQKLPPMQEHMISNKKTFQEMKGLGAFNIGSSEWSAANDKKQRMLEFSQRIQKKTQL